MKNLLLVICMLFGRVLSGQGIPFPDSNTVWHTMHIGACFGCCQGEFHWKEYLSGDTLLEDKIYSIVMFKSLCIYYTEGAFPSSLTISTIPPVMIGGIREDSGRVFFRKFNTAPAGGDYETILPFLPLDEDLLLYDFHWEVGDTHHVTLHDYVLLTYVVRSVNTFSERKHIYLEGLEETGYIGLVIEGVGDEKGLFGMYYSLASAIDFPTDVCMIQNDTLFFGGGNCFTCDDLTAIASPDIGALGIFPNPAYDEVEIRSGGLQNRTSVRVFNMAGTCVFVDSEFDEMRPLTTSGWGNSGLYFIQITDRNGRSWLGRVMIISD